MLNIIKDFFVYKAKSVEEFVEVIKRKSCKTVVVNQCLSTGGSTETTSVLMYMLEFTTTTPRGRKVTYREHLSERFRFADTKSTLNAVTKLLLLGDQKMKELQAKLPGVSVNYIGETVGQ